MFPRARRSMLLTAAAATVLLLAEPLVGASAPLFPSEAITRLFRPHGGSRSTRGWEAKTLTADHLVLFRVGGQALEAAPPPDAVTVVSAGERHRVVATGLHAYPIDRITPPWPPKALMRQEIILRLATALSNGESARIRVRLGDDRVDESVRFDETQVTPVVKVNQLGYLPADPRKTAYIAGYLGTLGALPVSPTEFALVDIETGKEVWRGRSADDAISAEDFGEKVLPLPFGPFDRQGRYAVQVAGVGRSVPFRIGETVFREPYLAVLRAYYPHRCGTPVLARHTKYARPACHADPEREGRLHGHLRRERLSGDEQPGTSLGATGGWHDASDFGKYIPTAASALYELFRVASLAPDLLEDGNANIPESGNGVPDLLDETIWELDWLLKMQRKDGAVYHKLTGRAWATDAMPHEDSQRRWVAPATTHDTAKMAAVMALGARHLRPHDAARADRYREAALRAWRFLSQHRETTPKGGFKNREWTGGGEYGDRFGDVDERAWAAVELYALTGEEQYHRAFRALLPKTLNPKDTPLLVADWPPPSESTWRFAFWSYATLPEGRASDDRVVAAIRDAYAVRAERLLRAARENPYGLSFDAPKLGDFFGFGNANGLFYARDLLLASHLLGRKKEWTEAAISNLDFFFGANGQSRSFMTGMGARAVENIEYSVDHQDDVAEPLPGHPVDGPSAGVHAANRDFEKKLRPQREQYPPMQRYFDFPDPIMNEPTIEEMALALVPISLLASPAQRHQLLPSTTTTTAPSPR